MTGVRLLGVTVTLGGCAVLDAISLTVEPGAWAALVGPNGAGKTTALRTIAGAVAHRGTVMLGSQDAATLGRRERARRVAVVPQTPATPADMRVREYVLLGRTPHLRWFGRETAADGAAADEALARLALTPLGARPLGSLSGGERQRAVLARALAQDPDVLLLDEPTSALDVARQQQVLELVDGLRRDEGLTVVAAMHDLTSVGLYADDVHLLSAGRLVASGPPDEVLEPALLSEHFGAAVRVIEHDGALVVVPVRTASVPGGTA